MRTRDIKENVSYTNLVLINMSLNGYTVCFNYQDICTKCIHQFGNELSGSLEFVRATGSYYRLSVECPHVEDYRGWSYYYGTSGEWVRIT